MLNTKDFLNAIDELEGAGIARDVCIQALKESLEAIFKRKNYEDTRVEVDIDSEGTYINIYEIKTIVDQVEDDNIQISLEDAQESDPNAQIGDDFKIKYEIDDFTKADVIKFKNVFRQKIKEAEKNSIFNAYCPKQGEIITGVVEKVEAKYTIINIGKTSVQLNDNQKIGEERFSLGQTVKVLLNEVKSINGTPKLFVTRANGDFLRRLFEEEVPDVYDGTVIIKSIARRAGERSKVSVTSLDENYDPVGACIGQGGGKIQKICSQLGKEKIDIVQYHEYAGLYIAEALKPANVISVRLDVSDNPNEKPHAIAIVENGQLKVAIGKGGTNVLLASQLTGCKIDIKEVDAAFDEGIQGLSLEQMRAIEEEQIRIRKRDEQIRHAEEQAKRIIEENNREMAQMAENVAPNADEVTSQEEVEAPSCGTSDPQEEVVAPQEEVKEEVKEEVVEYNPVNLQGSSSLEDIEKQIEQERKQKSKAPVIKKKAKKEEEVLVEDEVEEETKDDKEKNYMDIYTEEELAELDSEENDDSYEDDEEDVDYSEFDHYYDD